MPRNWRAATPTDAALKPPLPAGNECTRPEMADRPELQWEVPLEPGMDLGFSNAKGDIDLTPPEY